MPANYSQFLWAQTLLRPLRAMTVLAPAGAECEAMGWLSFNRMLMLLRGFGRYPQSGIHRYPDGPYCALGVPLISAVKK